MKGWDCGKYAAPHIVAAISGKDLFEYRLMGPAEGQLVATPAKVFPCLLCGAMYIVHCVIG
jgi:hypothetical protein